MKLLQTLGLVLIGLLICAIAIIISNASYFENIGIVPPIIIAYASYISLLFLGDKNRLFKSIIDYVWNLFFIRKTRVIIFNVIILFLISSLSTVIIDNYNKEKHNAYLKILNDGELVEEVSEEVKLFNILSQEDFEVDFSEDGFARVNIDIPGFYQITFGKYRFPEEKINSAPHQFLIDIKNISKKAEYIKQSDNNNQRLEFLKLPHRYLENLTVDNISIHTSDTVISDLVIQGISPKKTFFRRDNYAVNYNHLFKIPNCVVYKIQGVSKRFDRPSFCKDSVLNSVSTTAYSGSGYDRGHLVSTADMYFFDEQAVKEANYMSVVAPQAREMNRYVWRNIENYTRNFSNDTVFVIAGSIFAERDSLNNVSFIAIGTEKVAVPSHYYRIISRRINGKILTNAFLVPNRNDLNRDIKKYLTSVDRLEQLCGLDFFSNMDELNESEFERKTYELWE